MSGILVCELSAQLFLNGEAHDEMCEGEMSFRVIPQCNITSRCSSCVA